MPVKVRDDIILIRGPFGNTLRICQELKQLTRRTAVDCLQLNCEGLDALLLPAVQDLLESRTKWKRISFGYCTSLDLIRFIHRVDHVVLSKTEPHIVAGLLLAMEELHLLSLSIHDCSLSVAVAESLGKTLCSKSCALKQLTLGPRINWSDDAVLQIGEALQENRTIEEIKIVGGSLEDDQVASLVTSLQSHPKVTTLTVKHNFVQGTTIGAISELLLQNPPPNLSSIGVQYPEVWDDKGYMFDLFRALQSLQGCKLVSLSLPGNFLEDIHADAIFETLLHPNCTLRMLDLTHNGRLSSTVMARLCTILPKLRLKTLLMGFSEDICQANQDLVIQALSYNTVLERTDIGGENPSIQVQYFLALNRAGRRYKLGDQIPISLWPNILAKCKEIAAQSNIRASDIIYDFLHGPAFLMARRVAHTR